MIGGDLDGLHAQARRSLPLTVHRPGEHTLAQPTPDVAEDDRPGERVRHNGLGAPLDVRDEGAAKARLLEFVEVRRVVEFALGQLVERDAHDSDPRASVPKHVGGWARRECAGILRVGPSLRLFRPNAVILVRAEIVETLQQTLGEAGPAFRVQLQRFSLEIFDPHGVILRFTGWLGSVLQVAVSRGPHR